MKKIKSILPAVAIMFAVAGVFATENSTPPTTPVDVTLGHYLNTPNCIKEGHCTNVGAMTCRTNGGLTLRVITAGFPVTCAVDALGVFTCDN
jgi:hypothetical protein